MFERCYTVRQVSEMTGIPRRTIYDAIESGRLRAVMPNGCRRGYRITESAWSEYMEACASHAKEDE